jgi:hypothetical protein
MDRLGKQYSAPNSILLCVSLPRAILQMEGTTTRRTARSPANASETSLGETRRRQRAVRVRRTHAPRLEISSHTRLAGASARVRGSSGCNWPCAKQRHATDTRNAPLVAGRWVCESRSPAFGAREVAPDICARNWRRRGEPSGPSVDFERQARIRNASSGAQLRTRRRECRTPGRIRATTPGHRNSE